MKAHHTWLMALVFLCLAAACSSDPVSDSDASWSAQDLEERGDLITEIPAERNSPASLSIGALFLNERGELRHEQELTILADDEFYWPLELSFSQQPSYIFASKDSWRPTLLCERTFMLRIEEFESAQPERVALWETKSSLMLRGLVPGQASVRISGKLSLLPPFTMKSPSEQELSACKAVFGDDLKGSVPWRGELMVQVVRPQGVKLAFEPWPILQRGFYGHPQTCPADAQGRVRVIEGEAALLRYHLVNELDEPLNAKNWLAAEPFTLRQRQASPRLEFTSNRDQTLYFRSVEGQGQASLETFWGQSTLIEVIDRAQVADVELELFAVSGYTRIEDPEQLPAYVNRVAFAQGLITLRDGAQPCNPHLKLELSSLTPDVCVVEATGPTRSGVHLTEQGVRFLSAGRCEVVATWPGTGIRKIYSLHRL